MSRRSRVLIPSAVVSSRYQNDNKAQSFKIDTSYANVNTCQQQLIGQNYTILFGVTLIDVVCGAVAMCIIITAA